MNPDNDWVDCLTVDQLKKIWEPGSKVKSWKDVDDSFPDERLELFGPGTDSGTFDYFTGAIVGEEGASRSDYSATEDDNVIVNGVSERQGRARLHRPLVRRAEQGQAQGGRVDGGDGCVSRRPSKRSRTAATSRSPARCSSMRGRTPSRIVSR